MSPAGWERLAFPCGSAFPREIALIEVSSQSAVSAWLGGRTGSIWAGPPCRYAAGRGSAGAPRSECDRGATTLAKLEAWLKTRGCEPSWARADQVRVNEGFAMSQMLRSSLWSNPPTVVTSTGVSGHENFSSVQESARPSADLLSTLGLRLRTFYGDPLAAPLPHHLTTILGRLEARARDAETEPGAGGQWAMREDGAHEQADA